MAAKIKEIDTAAPAWSAAAAAVRTNNPAPIIAPMPKAIKLLAVKVLLRVFLLLSLVSSSNWEMGFTNFMRLNGMNTMNKMFENYKNKMRIDNANDWMKILVYARCENLFV